MNMYQMENLLNKDKERFKNLILEKYHNVGLNDALFLLRKSGICINPFGTGRPKVNKVFNEIIEEIKKYEIDKKKLDNFVEEVIKINDLYKSFNLKFVKNIELNLADDIHVISYLIALELTLSECTFKLLYEDISLNNGLIEFHENIVQSTGKILKYFIYKKYPFDGISRRITKKDVLYAREHINCSEYSYLLDIIQELWNYYDTEVKVYDKLIEIKAVGERALGMHISQMCFMDIREAKLSRHGLEDLINNQKYIKTKQLPPINYISSNEKTACEFIDEYIYIKDLKVQFDGISLAEYIRAYSVIELECKNFFKNRRVINNMESIALNDVCIVKTKNKWINLFMDVGIKKNSAKKLLEFMTFDEKSNDLFDSPLIKLGNNYVVVPSASFITDTARAILLNMNSKGINISVKGSSFEIYLRETIRNAGINCICLEKKDYECDVVFALDNTLFFVECKNLNIPTTYREYMRNLDEIYDACDQLDRIVNYYTLESNLIGIKKVLGINHIESFIKIVVTNTSQGQKLKVNQTFIVDDTLFAGFFKRTSPKLWEINKDIWTSRALFEEYYVGKISAKQLIDLMEKSPMVEHSKKRIEYKNFDYRKSLGVGLTTYSVKFNGIVFPEHMSQSDLSEFNKLYNL